MRILPKKPNARFSIRTLVILAVGLVLLLFMMVLVFIVYNGMFKILSQNENEQLEIKRAIVQNIINESMESARMFTHDWASNDDTYSFALGHNEGYMAKFWNENWKLQNQKYNFVLAKSLDGNDLYSKYYDYFSEESLPLPEGFSEFLADLSQDVLLRFSTSSTWPKGQDGFVSYNGTVYYICANPILPFDERSAPQGVLFFGRVFDNREIDRLIKISNTAFTVVYSSDPEIAHLNHDFNEKASLIVNTDKSNLLYIKLPSFSTNNSDFILKGEKQRDLYIGGINVIKLLLTSLVLSIVACAILVFHLLERYIIRPLERLSRDVRSLDTSHKLLQVDSHGDIKEFYTLAGAINGMLDRLAQSKEKELQSTVSLGMLQNILDSLEAYLFVADIETDDVLFVNKRLKERFGLDEDVTGKKCYSVANLCTESECELCAKPKLIKDRSQVVTWDECHKSTGRYYRKTDRLIEWTNGRSAHLLCMIDITETKQALELLEKRLKRQEVMAAVSQGFIINDNLNIFMSSALESLIGIMNADILVLLEYDQKKKQLIARYEMDSNGTDIKSNSNRLKMAFKRDTCLYKELHNSNFLTVAINNVQDSDYEEAKILGVKSALLVPIYAMGELWGILEFDKCNGLTWGSDDIYAASLIGNMFSGVLTRESAEGHMSIISDFFQIIRNPIFELDTELYFLKAYSDHFMFAGYSISQLLDKRLSSFMGEKNISSFEDMLKDAVERRIPVKEFKCHVKHKDGMLVDYELDILPIYDAYGTCIAYRASYGDITKRMNTKRQLIRASTIIDMAPQHISYARLDGGFDFFNPATEEITGYSYDELMEGGLRIVCDDGEDTLIREKIVSAIKETGTYFFETPIKRKDGAMRILSFSAFMISLPEGDGIGMIASDVTEQKWLEKELVLAKEAAERASRAKGEFLSRMSHEMRTPMSAIIGMTDIARNSNDPAKKEYCLEKIDITSKHLLNVINDILDMSKIEANKLELSLKEFDVGAMIESTMNVINFQIQQKEQRFNVYIDKNVPECVLGDEIRLSQVITNLLSNASKFTPEGGEITLNVKNIGAQDDTIELMVEVSDTGIGIPSEKQSTLFNSFEQADGSIARKYGGTGLGLAISKRIVELMGGTIQVESDVGEGSKFSFTVKVKECRFPSSMALLANIDAKNAKVLFVDDSLEARDHFVHLMNKMGLPCDVAEDGDQALRMIESNKGSPYNLFFVDLLMPNMTGIELTEKIRHLVGNAAIIILISVAEWHDIEKDAIKAGVNSFVSKPIFQSKLTSCINEYFGLNVKNQNKTSVESRNLKDYTVLLADDFDVNREIISAFLEETGLTIEFAINGLDAVKLFSSDEEKYDLILMDIHMPEMNGYEAAKNIRALGSIASKNVPIVAMTASVFNEDVEKCLAAGMDDHIGKPVNVDELLTKLNKYLQLKKKRDKRKEAAYKPIKFDVKKQEDSVSDYDEFLPTIDVRAGIHKLMENKNLYFTLLHNFKGRQMANEIIQSIKQGSFIKVEQAARALKGVCLNHGFTELSDIAKNIEMQAKMNVSSELLITALDEAVEEVINVIAVLLEREGIDER